MFRYSFPGILLVICGCSYKYSPIDSFQLPISGYDKKISNELIYRYEFIPIDTIQNKYFKKALKKNMAFIKVEITNNGKDIISTNDLRFISYSNYQPVEIVTSEIVKRKMHQIPFIHILYFIPGFFISSEAVKYYPVLAPIGIYHIIRSIKANANFNNDFITGSILDKQIMPGERITGWICVHDLNRSNYSLLIRK